MRELTRNERSAIRALVYQCSLYDRPGQLCLISDMVDVDTDCPMLHLKETGRLCSYFETAVLPLDSKLEAALTRRESAASKVCVVCGGEFVPKTNRQQYCGEKCKARGRKDHDREWRRNRRNTAG